MVDGGNATGHHRHNFDQVRIVLEGSFGFGPGPGPGLVQHAGSVGYFCEGTHYTQQGEGRSLTLLLQVGGPSGAGFMSRRQLRQGIATLRDKGEFHEGMFTWYDAQGIKHDKDSYEAVWEHVHRRPIQYAKPQYSAPVLMDPERFAWVPMPGREGIWLRTLGRFSERGLAITQLRLAAGAELEEADLRVDVAQIELVHDRVAGSCRGVAGCAVSLPNVHGRAQIPRRAPR